MRITQLNGTLTCSTAFYLQKFTFLHHRKSHTNRYIWDQLQLGNKKKSLSSAFTIVRLLHMASSYLRFSSLLRRAPKTANLRTGRML